jgi:UDP-2-acetamido-2-deoxy-ribo-hexuluronate aminotransferase
MKVPFIDLKSQFEALESEIRSAIDGVLAHGQFIMGPEVAEMESTLAALTGSSHCIAVASGTEALLIALMALGIGPGDEVIVPAFTFAATAEVVFLVGATPVLVDVEPDTANIDVSRVEGAISDRTRAIIPVALYGQAADMDELNEIAAKHGLAVIEDAAQSFGAEYRGRKSCNLSAIGCTSFFPSKPLGCYGDGGAIFTDDDPLDADIRRLRVHGDGARIGVNGRFDTVQAAILIEKLKVFPDEIAARNRIAQRYSVHLADVAIVPRVGEGMTSVWAQYTIRLAKGRRDGFATALKEQGIPTAIHYAKPAHWLEAYHGFPRADEHLPVSERLADEVISLPMHAYLDESTQDRIIAAVRRALGG